MKPKTIIVLAALLLLCAGYVVVRHTNVFTPGNPPEGRSEPVFSPTLSGIKKITIDPAGGEKIVLALENDRWHVAAPYHAKANERMANALVKVFADLQAQRSFTLDASSPDASGDSVTGLDKPLWTVKITDGKDAEHTLAIGRAVPFSDAGGGTYVRPEGEKKTCVVDVDFAKLLAPAAKQYRDLAFWSVFSTDLMRMSVEGSQSFVLQKDNNIWRLTKPLKAKADTERVSQMASALASLTAKQFVAAAPTALSAYGLDGGHEQLVVRFWTAKAPSDVTAASVPATASASASTSAPAGALSDETEYALALGRQTAQGVYAKALDQPDVFLVDASLLTTLQPAMADLRDRSILTVDATAVNSVEIKLPAGLTKLARKNGQWQISQPIQGPANDVAISKLLLAVSGLRAESFPETLTAGGLGIDNPRSRIVLHLPGKPDVGVLVGNPTKSGEMAFVAPLDGSPVAVVRTQDIEPLLTEPAGYYSSVFFRLTPPARFDELTIQKKDGKVTVGHNAQQEWAIVAPQPSAADVPSVGRITDLLQNLTAVKVVSLGPIPAKFTGNKDMITVTVVTKAPTTAPGRPASAPAEVATTTTLHLIKDAGKCYIWVDGMANTPVGEFAPAVYDTFAADLGTRTLWSIDSRQISSIRIVSEAGQTQLGRVAGKWVLAQDKYVNIDPLKVSDYLMQVGALQTNRVLSRNASDEGKYGLKTPAVTLELTTTEGKTMRLAIAKGDAAAPRPAVASTIQGVVELPVGAVTKVAKTWKDFQITREGAGGGGGDGGTPPPMMPPQ